MYRIYGMQKAGKARSRDHQGTDNNPGKRLWQSEGDGDDGYTGMSPDKTLRGEIE